MKYWFKFWFNFSKLFILKTLSFIIFAKFANSHLDESSVFENGSYEMIHDRKDHILFLNTYKDHIERMDRFFCDLVSAFVQNNHLINVDYWGPGFDGWNDSFTSVMNVAERFQNTLSPITIVWTSLIHFNFTDPNIITIHELGDCHNQACVKDVNPLSNITSVRYAHILPDIFMFNKEYQPSPHQLYVHNSDCANEQLFSDDIDFSSKTNDIFLYGAVHYILYPLRLKIHQGISNGLIYGKIYHHPGYCLNSLNDEEILSIKQYPIMFNSSANIKLNQENVDFSKHMMSTWICVFDSSIVRKTIRKFFQAMLAGCAIASDIPFDFPIKAHKFIIQIDFSWSYEKLNETLVNALIDKIALKERILGAKKFAQEYFTCQAKMNRILDSVAGYRAGWRGYSFPEGFRIDCNRYYSWETVNPVDIERHPWCTNKF